MAPRLVLYIGCAALVLIGAAGLYLRDRASPGCDSERVTGRVYEILRDEFHLDSMFLNNVRTESGGLFSTSRECVGEVAQIRGNIKAVDMSWREIRFRIDQADQSNQLAVTANLGGSVPLAPPMPSLWARLLSYL